jgi:alpha-glucosidase
MLENDRWKKSVHSEVNDEFVSNPKPDYGEKITIRIRIAEGHPVQTCWFRFLGGEHTSNIVMRSAGKSGGFDWFEIDFELTTPDLQYHFILETEDDDFFYTRAGLGRIHPTEDSDFVIYPGSKTADWVSESVFYQIYPDRFFRGDEKLGVRSGEYSFDGGQSIEMNWEDRPLEFEEGRCLDFFNGDLPGITAKLDYLQDLGVNALYLNPIFAAKTTHRYDCTDYFNVDEHLGGNEALAELTEQAHRRGMKVMVDVSINHTGIEHPWFKKAVEDEDSVEAGFYYKNPDGGYEYWFGVETLPQLNYGCEMLRNRIWKDEDSLVQKFLKPPFSIDGWRFDVANQVGRNKSDQYCHEIWQEIRKTAKSINPECYIIGEHWQDNISYHLGDQWDGAMNYFASTRPLRRWLGERDRFLRNGHHEIPGTRKAVNGYEFVQQIVQHFSRLPNQHAFQMFNLLDSHDVHRLHNHDAVFDPDLYAGVVMMLYMLPGTPSIYYGDELGIDGTIERVEGCRYPMPWQKTAAANEFFKLYQGLNHLKQSEKALHTGSFRFLYADEDSVVCVRFLKNRSILCIMNKATTEKEIVVDLSLLGDLVGEGLFSQKGIASRQAELKLEMPAKKSEIYLCTRAGG